MHAFVVPTLAQKPRKDGASSFIFLYAPNLALQRAHVGEEVAVGFGLAEFVDQKFHGFDGGQGVQDFAEDPDAAEVFAGD